MEWLLLVIAAAGGSAVAARNLAGRRFEKRQRAADLESVRTLADEDVTQFGEQLQRLDEAVAGRPLDGEGRARYQTALDAYESAKEAVPRMRSADQVSMITDTLSSGRYALACVMAQAQGRPAPEHRVPCFFNPAHGPSVTDVVWTQPRRGTRRVPACAQDAARVAAHEKPHLRTVQLGDRRVPYWEAGAAFAPYGLGYFAASAGLAEVFDPRVDRGLGAVPFTWSDGAAAGGWGAGDVGGDAGGGGF